MTRHQITDAEYAAALVAGRAAAEAEIRAQAVRYVPERDAIEIVTSSNAGFLIPRAWIGALQDVPTEDLAGLIGDRDRGSRHSHQRPRVDDRDPARDAAAAYRGGTLREPRREGEIGSQAPQRPGEWPERRPAPKEDRGGLMSSPG